MSHESTLFSTYTRPGILTQSPSFGNASTALGVAIKLWLPLGLTDIDTHRACGYG